MTKKEIVKTISEEIGLTQLKTKEIVQKTFDAIVETLVEDHRIELRNFGVFEVKRGPHARLATLEPATKCLCQRSSSSRSSRAKRWKNGSAKWNAEQPKPPVILQHQRLARRRKPFAANELGPIRPLKLRPAAR